MATNDVVRCEVDDQTVRVGSGWVNASVLWLVEDVTGGLDGDAKLVRWQEQGSPRGLVREEGVVACSLLRDGRDGWRRATDEEMEQEAARLTRVDRLDGIRQRQREQELQEQGSAIDRARVAEREQAREGEREVPAAAKGYWPRKVPDARVNAPMEERAGLVPQRRVQFEHSYPGAANPPDYFTSDCEYGCGAWAGPSRSGSRVEGVDPFGECPNHPDRLALKRRLKLAEQMQDLGERLIFEARELRRLAGQDNDENGGATSG